MKIFLTLALFLSVALTGQTTMNELDYIKNDYKDLVSNGKIPQKNGYTFEEIHQLDYGDEKQAYNFILTRMIHKEDGLKAIILSYYHKGKMETFCLPHPDTPDQVWITAIRDFNDYWSDKKRFPLFSSLFMKLMYLTDDEFKDDK